MDIDLPIPLYMKMKKAWEDKLLGLTVEAEEEDPETVEWQDGEEDNVATIAHGAILQGASSGFAASDGQGERNVLLGEADRQSAADRPERRFVFELDDSQQQITLDLKCKITPTKLGAEFSVKEDDHAVMESFSIQVSGDGESFVDWNTVAIPTEDPVGINQLVAQEGNEGPAEIQFIRFAFGSNHKSGSAVVQLFAYGRQKVKKQQQDLFPALCSDGRHLVFVHAGTVKSKDSDEKEAVVQAFVLAEDENATGFKVKFQTDFQWGLKEDFLFSCSFACNSEKVLVVHRKNFSSRTSDEKYVEFNVRTFELSTGRQINFSEVAFAKVKRIPLLNIML